MVIILNRQTLIINVQVIIKKFIGFFLLPFTRFGFLVYLKNLGASSRYPYLPFCNTNIRKKSIPTKYNQIKISTLVHLYHPKIETRE